MVIYDDKFTYNIKSFINVKSDIQKGDTIKCTIRSGYGKSFYGTEMYGYIAYGWVDNSSVGSVSNITGVMSGIKFFSIQYCFTSSDEMFYISFIPKTAYNNRFCKLYVDGNCFDVGTILRTPQYYSEVCATDSYIINKIKPILKVTDVDIAIRIIII